MLEKYSWIILKNNNKAGHTTHGAATQVFKAWVVGFPSLIGETGAALTGIFPVGLLDQNGTWLNMTLSTSKIPKSEMEFYLSDEIVYNINTTAPTLEIKIKFNNDTRN